MIIVNNYLVEVIAIYVKEQERFNEFAGNAESEPVPPEGVEKFTKLLKDVFEPINQGFTFKIIVLPFIIIIFGFYVLTLPL